MDLGASGEERRADGFDDAGQLVCADMRMGIDEDGLGGAMGHQDAEGRLHIAAFLRTGVQLAVAVSACTAFAEAVVAVRVDAVFAVDGDQIPSPLPHHRPPLENDGANAALDESQSRVQARRSSADDNDLGRTVGQGRKRRRRPVEGRQLLARWGVLNGQDRLDGTPPGVERAFHDAPVTDRTAEGALEDSQDVGVRGARSGVEDGGGHWVWSECKKAQRYSAAEVDELPSRVAWKPSFPTTPCGSTASRSAMTRSAPCSSNCCCRA